MSVRDEFVDLATEVLEPNLQFYRSDPADNSRYYVGVEALQSLAWAATSISLAILLSTASEAVKAWAKDWAKKRNDTSDPTIEPSDALQKELARILEFKGGIAITSDQVNEAIGAVVEYLSYRGWPKAFASSDAAQIVEAIRKRVGGSGSHPDQPRLNQELTASLERQARSQTHGSNALADGPILAVGGLGTAQPQPEQSPRNGSTAMSRVTQLYRRVTIGIITALPKEFIAVEIMLDNPVAWSAQGEGAGRRYMLGEFPAANSGTHAVSLVLLTDTGTNSAAVSANTLLHHFPSIRHIIMCGIAGGISTPTFRENDVRLGDIVVSDRNGVVGYDFVKQTPDEIQERCPPRPPGAELLEAVRLLEAKRLQFQRPWESFLQRSSQLEDAERPVDNQGADGEPISYPTDPKRRPGLPRVFYGTIASANRLLKDARFRDSLQNRFNAKAVEMEGSGIADATWLSNRAGYLVVRGICDFCDMRKGDLWQGYAAVAAAAYVRALVESMPVEADVRRVQTETSHSPTQR